MLNIIVCLKQVVDPESPASAYAIDAEYRHVIIRGAPPVISPFDESALEAALKLKDATSCTITAISMGYKLSLPVLRKALAAGADKLVIIEDASFKDADSYTTAGILVKAIQKIASFDLIFTGIQAADTNCGIVGAGIAATLGIPFVSNCRSVKVEGNLIQAKRLIDDGYQVLELTIPALLSVFHELGELRGVTLNATLSVQKKPITLWTLNDLETATLQSDRNNLLKIFIPYREAKCEFLSASNPVEAGKNLALKLKEINLI